MKRISVNRETQDFMTGLSEAGTVAAAWDETVAFMRDLGASHLHLSMDLDRANPTLLWTTPAWTAEQYLETIHPYFDPTIPYCRERSASCFSGVAFLNRHAATPAVFQDYLRDLAAAHWRSAVLFPVHGAFKGHWARFSVGTDRDADGMKSLYDQHGHAMQVAGTLAFNRIRKLMRRERAELVGLTETERVCLLGLASGLFKREIGDRLGIGTVIVTHHIERARIKLNAKTADHALVIALQLDLIEPMEKT
ncbi:MAG: autoinducer binding domain-containing protein [Hyphomicrobiaceae bacterium]|nr:autoinducer binding domain-containing protein [Hyphomicrobiaceae bacterium]